jgi:hypothetical protein
MAYEVKTWTDRISEYINRRTLTDTTTSAEQVVTVTRNEGTVSVEGDAFNATNMNNLESRISDALADGKSFVVLTESEYAALSSYDDTVIYMVKED